MTAGIEERIAALEERLAALAARVVQLENGTEGAATVAPAPPVAAADAPGDAVAAAPATVPAETAAGAPAEGPPAEGGVVGWTGRSSLMPRISTVSFLLVLALILRTLTDSGFLAPRPGAWVGMVYAAGLMGAAWWLYGRRSALAPVFALCGPALLATIVVETHSGFGSLGTVPAHAALGACALLMVVLGERTGRALPGTVGVLAVLGGGIGLSVPRPDFAALAALLLGVGALGAVVSRRLRGDWVGWSAFVVSSLVVTVWAVRLKVECLKFCDVGLPPAMDRFFPILAGFFLLWVGQGAWGLVRPPRAVPSVLSLVLPSLGALVAFHAAYQVTTAAGGRWSLGIVGLALAAATVAVAAWGGLRGGGGAAALNGLAVAGAMLAALSFGAVTGSFLGALPLLSLTALGFAILSRRWGSGGARLISYLLQVFVALALAALLLAGARTEQAPAVAALASAVLAASALFHHRWCRRHAPPAGSAAFAFLGRGDRCAVALLTAALAGGFFLLRTGAFVLLSARGGDFENLFLAAQSLLINLSAVALLAIASARRDAELRNVAVIVTFVGAAKVFLYDMMATQGVPRVLSVFSIGVLAAVASLVLGRWHRRGSA